MRASYGTGFKAPTLSDLFSTFGSRDLKPEKSHGWDAGIEQAIFTNKLVAQGTYFSNRFTDLIDFDFVRNKLQNIGHAESRGVEAGLSFRPIDPLVFSVSYAHTETEDLSTHTALLRRP